MGAHRLVFASVALRLTVYFMAHADYNPCIRSWVRPRTDGRIRVVDFVMDILDLRVPSQPGGTLSVKQAVNEALAVGVTRAMLYFDVAACVGLLRPELLVPEHFMWGNDMELQAPGLDSDTFARRYLRVIFGGF